MPGAHVDHLVVGAGSAGCVVASILAQDPARSVLLVEAGPDREPFDPADPTTSPDLFRALATDSRRWPDATAQRSPHGVVRPYARGRGLGGSSAINGLVCLPGRAEDYNRWERDYGCTGWGWDFVRGSLRELQQHTIRLPASDWGGVDLGLRDSAVDLGFAELDGHDGQHGHDGHDVARFDGVGAAPLGLVVDVGGRAWRGSSDALFLTRIRDRPNLAVRCNTSVDQLLVDGTRVHGSRLIDGDEIEASHVTLCAGAIQSPAILLRSGIDRPGVGANLHDHTGVTVTLELRTPMSPTTPVTGAVLHADGIQVTPCNRVGIAAHDLHFGSLLAVCLRTYGRGFVHLRADDPSGWPEVVFDSVGDERDRTALRRAARLLGDLTDRMGPSIKSVAVDDLRSTDDASLDRWIENNLADVLHAAGTCRMGSPSDEMAVVDSSCAVIGYRGLSVIDASVMPELPSANPHLPIMMVATRATRRLVSTLG